MVATEDSNVNAADGLFHLNMPEPREGWELYHFGNGTFVSFPVESEPRIKWKHIDGPMLVCRDGTPHWLTWWERFCLRTNIYDIKHLDKKHGYYHKQRRLA